MFKLFGKRTETKPDAYGVLYLHVEKNGEPFCILNIGNALCRVIGEKGYGVTIIPAEQRFCAWEANSFDFNEVEATATAIPLKKQSEAEEDEEEANAKPVVYVAEKHGTAVRLLVWRNQAYSVEFHTGDKLCRIEWNKQQENFSVGANLNGDPSIILEFAEAVVNEA
jgi:hypothetical protein